MGVLPPDSFRDFKDARVPLDIISRMFDVDEWKLRVYEIVLPELFDDYRVSRTRHIEAPSGLLDRIPGAREVVERLSSGGIQAKCTRCEILEGPENPIEGELCLWCRVEAAGWSVLAWHEAGCPDVFEKGE